METTKKRTPGVPDEALVKAAGASEGLIGWALEDAKKITTLSANGSMLTAGNNTLLVAELIRFWVEAQQ